MKYVFNANKIGTVIEIIINDDKINESDINNYISFLWDYVDLYEKEFSRFILDSDLSKLNNLKSLKVSDLFIDIFNKSYNLYKYTNNFFNPLLNLKTIGYTNNFNENNFEIINEDQDLEIENVVINGNEIILKNNQNLDFGGIAKGYLVDILSSKLKEFGVVNYLVNAGGDLYVNGLNDKGEKWGIGIENPYEKGYIGTIKLSHISISTSGSYKRHWTIDGKNYHHIVNPINLKNETSLVGISIISSKCYITDSLATAIFCMGMDMGKEFMIKNGIDGILFGKNKNIFLPPNFKQKYSFI